MKSTIGNALGAGIGLANRWMGAVPEYEQAIRGLELEKPAAVARRSRAALCERSEEG